MRTVSLLTLSLLVVAGSGCDSDQSIGVNIASGSRLHARYWVAPGGAEVFADWYDSEFAVTCSPQQPSDGPLRCVPTASTGAVASAAGSGTSITALYADAACTQRIKQWRTGCEAPTVITSQVSGTCGNHPVVHEVTGEATLTELFGVDALSGECRFVSTPLEGSVFLHLGEEISPTAFVALEELAPGGSGRLRRRLYGGDDGSLLERDLYDADLDTVCLPMADADGQLRCLPHAIASYSYADPQCQTPMAQWIQPDAQCNPPAHSFARIGELVGCTLRQRVYALGAPSPEVTPYTLDFAGTCAPSEPPPGTVGTLYGWTAGPELTPDTFVALEAQTVQGEGRLQAVLHEDSGGFVAREELWDSERQEMCRPTLMADGRTRCAPSARGLARDTFADPQCQTPLPSTWVQLTDCLSTDDTNYAVAKTDDCPQSTRLYEVGASLDGSPLYEQNMLGECTEALWAGQYALGAEIPASDFVELTLEQR